MPSSSAAVAADTEAAARAWRIPAFAAPAAFLLALVALWELCCRAFEVPAFVLPSPVSVVAALVEVGPARWTTHTAATLRVALAGYAVSIAVGIPLAVALTRSRTLSRVLYPPLIVVQSTPIVAIAPVIIVLLGVGDAPRILVTCLITFFPIVVATATGIEATPAELIELSRSLRAPAWREVLQIRLPFAIPHVFSALRISITLAIIGAVVSEFVAAEAGLGYFIQFSTSVFKMPQAFAGLVVLAAVSLVLFYLVGQVQRWFFAWSLPR